MAAHEPAPPPQPRPPRLVAGMPRNYRSKEYFASLPKINHMRERQPAVQQAAPEQLPAATGLAFGGAADHDADQESDQYSAPEQPGHRSRAQSPRSRRANAATRTCSKNAKLHQEWEAALPSLLPMYIIRRGVLAVDTQSLPRSRLASDLPEQLRDRARRFIAVYGCQQCGADGSGVQLVSEQQGPRIKYCALGGWADNIHHPTSKCSFCSATCTIHPILLGCFPASPSGAGVWFDEDVLALGRCVWRHGHFSITALSKVIQDMQAWHMRGQATADSYHDLRALTQALTAYQIVQVQLESCSFIQSPEPAGLADNLALHKPPGMSGCPSCWRTCEAVCMDACMGMRKFGNSARTLQGLRPLIPDSLFVADARVEALLAARAQGGQGETSNPGVHSAACCSDFKAAQFLGKHMKHYDRTGVVAALCRHGFVLRACSMTTGENYGYYELVLADVGTAYSVPGRQLRYVFVDIACRLQQTLSRAKAQVVGSGLDGVKLLVGPWHLLAHKASCQVLYNPRLMAGTGLTFGDLPEHLWAAIRKYAASLAYMGEATRQDIMSILFLEREMRKTKELPSQLVRQHKRAHDRAVQTLVGDLQRTPPDRDRASPCQQAWTLHDQGINPAAIPKVHLTLTQKKKFQLASCLEKLHVYGKAQVIPGTPFTSPRSGQVQARQGSARLALEADMRQWQEQANGLASELDMTHLQYNSTEYWEICAESKDFHIRRLHSELDTALRTHGQLSSRLVRQHTIGRHEPARFGNRRSKLAATIMRLCQELAEQHQLFGALRPEWRYSPAALKQQLDTWLHGPITADCFQLPWCQGAGGVATDQRVQAEQLYLRCMEEVEILQREACDFVEYHELQVASMCSMISSIKQVLVNLSTVSSEDALPLLYRLLAPFPSVPTTGSETAVRRRAELFYTGLLCTSVSRQTWLEDRLEAGKAALAKMLQLTALHPLPGMLPRAAAAPEVNPAAAMQGTSSLSQSAAPGLHVQPVTSLTTGVHLSDEEDEDDNLSVDSDGQERQEADDWIEPVIYTDSDDDAGPDA